ncbi:hypothetical protein CEXT_619221 [Caerostris extrusa]|uniref:Uncharacterized protein n=1 Tax=Caerostris extrusa TaxID=172846 RepID=A0AAV4S7Q6_CAEEX|nr:hypothetical protein CEXT_619221 [Caerostris extrusa]
MEMELTAAVKEPQGDINLRSRSLFPEDSSDHKRFPGSRWRILNSVPPMEVSTFGIPSVYLSLGTVFENLRHLISIKIELSLGSVQ